MKHKTRPAGLLLGAALLALSVGVHAHGPSGPSGGHSRGGEVRSSADQEQQPWGRAGQARAVTRTVDITLSDRMRFIPDRLEVRQGETLRLRFRNEGALLHEFVLGTPQSLAEHAEQMLKFPGMEHEAPYMAHVQPGGVGEIVWTFNRAGEFGFACLIAGHSQAGMVGHLTVQPGPQGRRSDPGQHSKKEHEHAEHRH